jgi:hypothetical protein
MQWFTSKQGKGNSQASPSELGASKEGLKKDGQANGGPSQGSGLAPTPDIKGPTVSERSTHSSAPCVVFHCSRCGEFIPENHKYGDPCKRCGGLIVGNTQKAYDIIASEPLIWLKRFDDRVAPMQYLVSCPLCGHKICLEVRVIEKTDKP